MTSRVRAPNRSGRGIPLVEIVVVLLVGLIAAVAVPTLVSQKRKAVDLTVRIDLRTIATHLEPAQLDAGTAPLSARFASPILALGDAKISLSAGNVPRIFRKGTGKYCVQVTNPGATDPSLGRVWKVGAGGLQAAGQSCAGYRTLVL